MINKQDLKNFVNSAKETRDKSSCANLASKLFHCRDITHLAHLRSQSYSEHVALNDLYDAVLDSADEITELMQGYVGILEFSIPLSSYTPILPYLKAEQKELTKSIKDFQDMPDVQNKLQDLLAVFSKSIYKLENLK